MNPTIFKETWGNHKINTHVNILSVVATNLPFKEPNEDEMPNERKIRPAKTIGIMNNAVNII